MALGELLRCGDITVVADFVPMKMYLDYQSAALAVLFQVIKNGAEKINPPEWWVYFLIAYCCDQRARRVAVIRKVHYLTLRRLATFR
ncbi:hypothetical protein ACO0LE_19540 [Undibacterium sp. Xuan67W]